MPENKIAILDGLEFVQKMLKPLTEEQAKKILSEYPENEVQAVLENMENYMKNGKTIDKCYTSANLTLRKWLKIGYYKETMKSNDPFGDIE